MYLHRVWIFSIPPVATLNVHFSLVGAKKMLDGYAAPLPRYRTKSLLGAHINYPDLRVLLIPVRRDGVKNETKIALLPGFYGSG
jgi:hypothetical protein